MSYLKKLRKKRREKKDISVYDQKDNQKKIPNMEEDRILGSVGKTPGTIMIAKVAKFIADNFHNGCYNIERYTGSQYRFGFGIVEHGKTRSRYIGKTLGEAISKAVLFELSSEEQDIVSYERIVALADDRMVMIQEERQRYKKLESKIDAKKKEYAELTKKNEDLIELIGRQLTLIEKNERRIKEFQDKLIAKEKESEDLASLAGGRLATIQKERQEIKKLEEEIAMRDAKCAEIVKRKNDKLIAKDAEYDELTMKYRDSEAFISEQEGVIEENKQRIKEFQDDIASKESENAALTKENGKNKAYIKIQEKVIGRLQEKVNVREEENTALTKEKEKVEEEREEISPVETLLPKGKVIHTVHHGRLCRRIHENVWNDMENTLMDGDSHTFPELERFFRKYWGHQLRKRSIDEVKEGYFFYAKEIEHYPYERRMVGGLLKFRFGKKPELKKSKIVKDEETGLELGMAVDHISKHPIYKNPRDEFIRLFCDGDYYCHSEMVERFRKYEGYNRLKRSSLVRLTYAYKAHIRKFYRMNESHGKFKFERKTIEGEGLPLGKEIGRVGNSIIFENPWNEFERVFCDGKEHLYSEPNEMLRKYERYNRYTLSSLRVIRVIYFRYACKYYRKERPYDHKAFRFLPIGEGVEERIEGEGLPLGKEIGRVGRSKIFENPWNEFERVFCDGDKHLFSEANEMFRKYERYNWYTLDNIPAIRGIYSRYACKYYRKKMLYGRKAFRFLPIGEGVEERIEGEGLPLGKEIGRVGCNKIFENPWNEFERVFCDGKEHLYSEANEMFRKYERYDQYTLGGLCLLRGIYSRHAYKYYRKERPPGHKTFRFLPIEEPVEEWIEEKETLELGPRINVIARHSIFKNPYDEFEMRFCDDNPHHHSEIVKVLKKYDRYNRYKEETLKDVSVYYIRHASKFYWASEKTGRHIFKTEGKKSEIEVSKYLEGDKSTYKIIKDEIIPGEIVEEKIEKKEVVEKKKEFRPIRDKYGKRLYNDATEKVRESYPDAIFHKKPVKELSQELNESVHTVMSSLELRKFFNGILQKTYIYASANRCDYYIKYFKITKMLNYVKGRHSARYEIYRDVLIPKKKNKLGILDRLGM